MHRPDAKKYIVHSHQGNSLLSHVCTSRHLDERERRRLGREKEAPPEQAPGLQVQKTLRTDSSLSFAMTTGPLSLQNIQQQIIVYFDKLALC